MKRTFRPFFSYFGAKWRAAPRYPVPEHDTIVEPFAGAAGYSTSYFRRNVILVDKNPVIVGLWDFLIHASREDILRIPMLRDGQTVPELDAPKPARDLVGFWINQGTPTPHNVPSTWAKANPDNHWSEKQRARIAAQVECIRHWRIIEGDYSNAPDIEATWFVDPPYQKEGVRYPCSSKQIDFAKLGEWCRTRRGLAMVCENEGADWLPFVPFFRMSGGAIVDGKRKRSVEVVWVERTS